MRVLIAGASGFIGRHLAAYLDAAGHRLILCSRSGTRLQLAAEHETCKADFSRDGARDWVERLKDADAAVNAAGIFIEDSENSFENVHAAGPAALFQACLTANIGKLIHISALGAAGDAPAGFLRSKSKGDELLQDLARKHDRRGWVAVRPSLVIGQGGGSTALFAAMAALPRPLSLGRGTWQVQPLHIRDLCEGICRLIEFQGNLPPIAGIAGPAPMTTDELTDTLRQWLGLRPRPFLRVPERILRPVLFFSPVLTGGLAGQDSLTMLKLGNVSGQPLLGTNLGWQPQSIAKALAAAPSSQADLWHARLFFLQPLLRLTLAFLWIATAFTSAFVFPLHESVAMIRGLGVEGVPGEALVYAASVWDCVLGVALLVRFRPVAAGLLQIVTMVLFTVLATIAVPSAWFEPFGPLTKNIPIIAATLVMIALEART